MIENTKNKEQYRHLDGGSDSIQYRTLTNIKNLICCPNCKKSVDKAYELCPHCSYRLHSSHCTYCGAPMLAEDLFCGECGGNSKGTPCPSCGMLSFRSFCPNCNSPVDEIGEAELEKAKADPLFQRICSLAKKIIEANESGEPIGSKGNSLSPEILSLLQRYRSIQSNIGVNDNNNTSNEDDTFSQDLNIDTHQKGIQLYDSGDGIRDISSAIEELDALMKSMIPDPGLTPQMQRNYYSARKVAVYRKSIVREPVGWVCNLCGCHHGSPSECARPELGGRWIYQDKEITTKTYE